MKPNEILKKALALKLSEKAKLIEELLLDLDKPDKELDRLWMKEAEGRIDGYEKGEIKAITLDKVLEKYR